MLPPTRFVELSLWILWDIDEIARWLDCVFWVVEGRVPRDVVHNHVESYGAILVEVVEEFPQWLDVFPELFFARERLCDIAQNMCLVILNLERDGADPCMCMIMILLLENVQTEYWSNTLNNE